MGYYVDELIDLYESGQIDGDSLTDQVTRITNKEEYVNDVNQNRIKEKISAKYDYIRYGKSPEDIIIEWERSEKIIHFIDWIRSVLNEEDWYIFTQYNLHNKSRKEIAKSLALTTQTIDFRLSSINRKIQKSIPYYNEQFGDLKEYLER